MKTDEESIRTTTTKLMAKNKNKNLRYHMCVYRPKNEPEIFFTNKRPSPTITKKKEQLGKQNY